jgi:hypothetical protein
LVINAPSLEVGNALLLQSFGIGPLRANTILLNHHGVCTQSFLAEEFKKFGKNLRTSLRLGYNLIIMDTQEEEWQRLDSQPPDQRRIDIWYQAGKSGSLMLLLGHLLTRAPFWEQATLRVITVKQNEDSEATTKALQLELEQARINAEAVIVDSDNHDAIITCCADASLVILPLSLKTGQVIDCCDVDAETLLPQLPLVALVLAAQQIDLDAEPETGAAGLLAAAEDALATAQKRVDSANKEVQELTTAMEETLHKLLTSRQQGEEDQLESLYEEIAKIRQQLDKATRRSAKADTKLEQEKLDLEKLQEQYHVPEAKEVQ